MRTSHRRTRLRARYEPADDAFCIYRVDSRYCCTIARYIDLMGRGIDAIKGQTMACVWRTGSSRLLTTVEIRPVATLTRTRPVVNSGVRC